MDYPLLLFDLAVLYRALAFGADDDLDPAEAEEMRARIQAWAPGEAALADVGALAIGEVLVRVGTLSPDGRARVLADLRGIAEADGRVTKGEEGLLALVERALQD